MTDTRTVTRRSVFPIATDVEPADAEMQATQLKWLAHESCLEYAAREGVQLLEFRVCPDGDPADYAATARALGRPATDFRWHVYEGVFTTRRELVDDASQV